jgi:hypothetical protein
MRPARAIAVSGMLLLGGIISNLVMLQPAMAAEQTVGSFQNLLGWWSGNGWLRFKDGNREEVKCRATYRWDSGGGKLLQAVRCASASGKVDIKSEIQESGGKLTGSWRERTYEFEGDLLGEVMTGGFRVTVSGSDVKANMAVFVKEKRQIVEVQFLDNVLLGISIIFKKG